MAKCFFAPNVAYMSGKIGEGVYMITPKQGMSYIRSYVYPKITPTMHSRGKGMKNVASIWDSDLTEVYKDDMRRYAAKYAALNYTKSPRSARATSPFSLFYMLIWNMCASDPSNMDITTVTFEDLTVRFPTVNTIYIQCLMGFIPNVPGFEDLNNPWD